MSARDVASLSNHSPALYNKHANFVFSAQYTAPVLALLKPQPGERIVDLGCGSGELTELIRNAVGPNGFVLGVDSSAAMLEKARGVAANGAFIQADIQALPSNLDPALKGSFDAVFTNATLHWCKSNPEGVVEGMAWLLKPGGRIAFEFGGFGNAVGVRAALHEVLRKKGVDPVPRDPWYFPTVEQYKTLLARKGLTSDDMRLVPRPTPLTTDLYGWLETFARKTFFADFSDAEADAMMRRVEEICAPDNFWSMRNPGQGIRADESSNEAGLSGWEIMYVRLRGSATRIQNA